jgi:hypothetical protein
MPCHLILLDLIILIILYWETSKGTLSIVTIKWQCGIKWTRYAEGKSFNHFYDVGGQKWMAWCAMCDNSSRGRRLCSNFGLLSWVFRNCCVWALKGMPHLVRWNVLRGSFRVTRCFCREQDTPHNTQRREHRTRHAAQDTTGENTEQHTTGENTEQDTQHKTTGENTEQDMEHNIQQDRTQNKTWSTTYNKTEHRTRHAAQHATGQNTEQGTQHNTQQDRTQNKTRSTTNKKIEHITRHAAQHRTGKNTEQDTQHKTQQEKT